MQLGFSFLQLKPVALFLFGNMVYAWFVVMKEMIIKGLRLKRKEEKYECNYGFQLGKKI